MITFLMPRSRITNIVAVILDYLLFLKVLLHPDCPICHNKIKQDYLTYTSTFFKCRQFNIILLIISIVYFFLNQLSVSKLCKRPDCVTLKPVLSDQLYNNSPHVNVNVIEMSNVHSPAKKQNTN
jgi:hypothetical protein